MSTEITANIVIEMMGRPKPHLKKTITEFIGKIAEEERVEILNKQVNDPKVIEQKDQQGNPVKFEKGKELYSAFADIELRTETLLDLTKVVFKYMPSHVEITSPSSLKLKNFEFASVLTEITRRLHQYDAIAKNAMMQNQMLAKKFMELKEQKSDTKIKTKTKKKSKK